MKILNTQQVRDCDEYTIDNEPIASIDLMERAANQLFNWVINHYSTENIFYFFVGTGNNGGDALALARLLFNFGYNNINIYVLKIGRNFSKDCLINIKRIELVGIDILYLQKNDTFPDIIPNSIVFDGIFGSGLSREVAGYWGKLITHINNTKTTIIAIDLPSGVFSEDNRGNKGVKIKADITLMFQFSKLANLFAENYKYFGQWHILNIGLHKNCIKRTLTNKYFIDLLFVKNILKVRDSFDHKGVYGHSLLIAGSYGKMGAAIFSAKATLKSGVGLLTVLVPKKEVGIMQISVPEAMIFTKKIKNNNISIFNAIGIGPGLGISVKSKKILNNILNVYKSPIVLDADALNIISQDKDLLNRLPALSILTPHPKEFDRLTKLHNHSYERYLSQIEFSKKYNVIVVLKGRYTTITTPDGISYFNSSGNPGMATAGSGDVLTGIILSLLTQKYTPKDAAILGVFLHGLSGDIISDKIGQNALIATDIINNLGYAFIKLLT